MNRIIGLNSFAKEVHAHCLEKGFYDNPGSVLEILCLVHTEISEAVEADRKGNRCGANAFIVNNFGNDERFLTAYEDHIKGTFEEEMADIILRVLDLCAFKRIDIEMHLLAKMRYNKSRPHLHGKKY